MVGIELSFGNSGPDLSIIRKDRAHHNQETGSYAIFKIVTIVQPPRLTGSE